MLSPSQLETLQSIDTVIRMVGWPAFIGACIWAVRKWDAGQREFQDVHANTKAALETSARVEAVVEKLTNNHMAHLQDGIIQLAASNEEAVTILRKIDTGIQILNDRDRRA